MPSHRMNSGTQAIEGIARSACRVGSSRRARQRRIAGDRAEQRAGGDAEHEAGGDARAASRRCGACSSPVRASSAKVCEDHRRRRHQPAVGPARAHGDLPDQRERRPAAAGRAPAARRARAGLRMRRRDRLALARALAVMATRDITALAGMQADRTLGRSARVRERCRTSGDVSDSDAGDGAAPRSMRDRDRLRR